MSTAERQERLVASLLERAARACPAASEEFRHGWWLRHTDTSLWWSGAVLADGARHAPLDAGIGAAEAFYARHRAAARFQVCPDCPAGLDTTLAQRGYRLECPISLQVAPADDVAASVPVTSLHVQVDDRLGAAWLAACEAAGAAGADREAERRALARVASPSGYATAVDSGEPVAVGRAVAGTGWTGVFAMATAPHTRGRGAARAILCALARWAVQQSSPRMYLQVEPDNAPARRLYEAAGFGEIATYHYRVRTRPVIRVRRSAAAAS